MNSPKNLTGRTGRTSLALLATPAILAASLVTAPLAAADPASATHKDSTSTFTRSVSEATVQTGSEVTYTQRFEETSKSYIYEWKNNVDSCLDYVAGSATVQKG